MSKKTFEDVVIPNCKDVIENATEALKSVSQLKEKYMESGQEINNRYYECERLEHALQGTITNLDPFSRKHSLEAKKILTNINEICTSLTWAMQRDHLAMDSVVRPSLSTLTAAENFAVSGSSILNDSTALYIMNSSNFDLAEEPPSKVKELDPYITDQQEIEKELPEILRAINPSLETLYLGAKDQQKSAQRAPLRAACAEYRTLIWKILDKLAPHEEVTKAPGFKQSNEKRGMATNRQRTAYIVTGRTDINGPDEKLIGDIFETLDDALRLFSKRVKTTGEMSNFQITMTIARMERAIWTLLKNV